MNSEKYEYLDRAWNRICEYVSVETEGLPVNDLEVTLASGDVIFVIRGGKARLVIPYDSKLRFDVLTADRFISVTGSYTDNNIEGRDCVDMTAKYEALAEVVSSWDSIRDHKVNRVISDAFKLKYFKSYGVDSFKEQAGMLKNSIKKAIYELIDSFGLKAVEFKLKPSITDTDEHKCISKAFVDKIELTNNKNILVYVVGYNDPLSCVDSVEDLIMLYNKVKAELKNGRP